MSTEQQEHSRAKHTPARGKSDFNHIKKANLKNQVGMQLLLKQATVFTTPVPQKEKPQLPGLWLFDLAVDG
ncbi:MAG TPA: hypothetical protein VJV96_07410 [Candidatus Angelobacter sp.]|nr:hypothetical protein [Candidatus Angelobacter sp.]HKT50109.1 hypothetical protein [Candidatus Angelobacter sp.]